MPTGTRWDSGARPVANVVMEGMGLPMVGKKWA